MKDAKWKIEISDIYPTGSHGNAYVNIWAAKEGEENQSLVWRLDVSSNAEKIENAARIAVIGVARLNTGLASAKYSIREKLLDVIETVSKEESEDEHSD